MPKKFLLICALLASISAQAQESEVSARSALSTLLTQAIKSEVRTAAEVERDRNRRPLQTLEFFGITPEMKVLELIPGGGWYTKLLAPVLREKGELYVAIGISRVKSNLLEMPGLDKIKVLEPEFEVTDGEDNLRTINKFSLNEKGFDAALTFRNMHNFDAAGRKNINDAVFQGLKKGGIYGIVDHTRRHMEPITRENRRRVDPVTIIKELLDAGFVFEGYSDMHYKPDDELRYEVGRKSVTGNTDRLTFLFKKP
ncbi:MAG: class I SAM-dependent methyltransferase [Arenicella sp.]|nr:class I SAM-dependent methyltransferase [Arenicella sp.]